MPEPSHCACIGMQWTSEVRPFKIVNLSPRSVDANLNHFGTFRRAVRILCAISFTNPRRILLLSKLRKTWPQSGTRAGLCRVALLLIRTDCDFRNNRKLTGECYSKLINGFRTWRVLPWKSVENQIPASNKKCHVSLTKISLMIFFFKLTAVYSENQAKIINAICGRQVTGRTSSWQVFSYVLYH